MSRIRSEFSDFRQATSWFSIDFSMKNEVPWIFSKNIASDAVFHADSESELSLVRISFQTRNIQHRTCKNDRFRHRVPRVDSFSLPCPRKSPHEKAPVCGVFHGLQTGVLTNLDRYILTQEHRRLSWWNWFFHQNHWNSRQIHGKTCLSYSHCADTFLKKKIMYSDRGWNSLSPYVFWSWFAFMYWIHSRRFAQNSIGETQKKQPF